MKRYAIEVGVMLGVKMIADDQHKFTRELPVALPVQKIHQAMVVFGDKNGDPRAVIAQANHPIHAEVVSDGAKSSVKVFQVEAETVEVPLDAREIVALFAGLMLLEVEDIAVVAVDKFGDAGVEAFAVCALH